MWCRTNEVCRQSEFSVLINIVWERKQKKKRFLILWSLYISDVEWQKSEGFVEMESTHYTLWSLLASTHFTLCLLVHGVLTAHLSTAFLVNGFGLIQPKIESNPTRADLGSTLHKFHRFEFGFGSSFDFLTGLDLFFMRTGKWCVFCSIVGLLQ